MKIRFDLGDDKPTENHAFRLNLTESRGRIHTYNLNPDQPLEIEPPSPKFTVQIDQVFTGVPPSATSEIRLKNLAVKGEEIQVDHGPVQPKLREPEPPAITGAMLEEQHDKTLSPAQRAERDAKRDFAKVKAKVFGNR